MIYAFGVHMCIWIRIRNCYKIVMWNRNISITSNVFDIEWLSMWQSNWIVNLCSRVICSVYIVSCAFKIPAKRKVCVRAFKKRKYKFYRNNTVTWIVFNWYCIVFYFLFLLQYWHWYRLKWVSYHIVPGCLYFLYSHSWHRYEFEISLSNKLFVLNVVGFYIIAVVKKTHVMLQLFEVNFFFHEFIYGLLCRSFFFRVCQV